MKYKITIGDKVFDADLVERIGENYSLLKMPEGYRRILDGSDLRFLGAKIEPVEPFRFEADVGWSADYRGAPMINWVNSPGVHTELIGKRGKLIFIEDES